MFESYGLLAIIFLIAGLVILVTEVFVPSGGLLAILTSITLCFSLVMAYSAWYESSPVLWWGFLLLELFAIPLTLGGAFYILPRTSVGREILLEAPGPDDVEPFSQEIARLEKLIGKFGVAQTILSPGGLVLVENERLHAFTEGQMVDVGTSIEVLEVRGTRLLVRPAEPPMPAQPPQSSRATEIADTSVDPGSRVDFDFPTE